MPGGSKEGGGLEVKSDYKSAVASLSDQDPFKMRSGNSPLFKEMGSSPLQWPSWLSNLGGKKNAAKGIQAANVNAQADDAITAAASGTTDAITGKKTNKQIINPETNAARIDALEASVGGKSGEGETTEEGMVRDPITGMMLPANVGGSMATTTPSAQEGMMAWISDIRLKEKIERTGSSPSGIPIYEFNYIGDNNRYSGAMAQDLLEMNIDAVSVDESGYYRVNYNNIDVDMHLIN